MITYAAVVWWPLVNYTTVEKQLELVQRLACLYITGAMHTTLTIALQMIISLTPLDVHIKQEAVLSYFRLQVNSKWVSNACNHTSFKNTLQHIVLVSHKQCDRIIPQYMLDRNYVVEIPSRSDWIWNNVELKDNIVRYTVGFGMELRKLTRASVYDKTHNKQHMFRMANRLQFIRLKYTQF